MEIREGINQYIIGKNIIPNIVLSQLRDKLKIFVEGSKIENKFIIIFSIRIQSFFLNLFF